MKLYLLIIILTAVLSGCIPLAQTHIHPSRTDFICHVSDGGLYIGWQSNSAEPSKQSDIDISSSWAVSPKGHVYAFNAVPRTYLTGEKSYWRDTTLYLRELNMSLGKDSKRWGNGNWKLHLAFTNRISHKPIDAEVKISTFYYNPIIHGPPN